MMESILYKFGPITYFLAKNRNTHLMLTDSDTANMKVIITLLKPFKECGEKLSCETNVTISLVIPLFEKLKEHLKNNGLDCSMITDMKATMLATLKTRYSSDEMQ